MMASAFKIVVILLACLQITEQASISIESYNKNLDHINNKLTSYPSYNVPSIVKSKDPYEFINSDEGKSLNIDRGIVTNARTKRQDNQDLDLDAEIISNDPEMFSYGTLMPMKINEDDDTLKHHGSVSLDDVDAETSNKLSVLEDTPLEGNETVNKVEKIETHENTVANKLLDNNYETSTQKITEERVDETSSQSAHHSDTESHDSTHTDLGDSLSEEKYLEEEERDIVSTKTPTQSQDDTHVNSSEESGVMSDEGYLTPNPPDQDNIEENLLHEENDKSEVKQNINVAKDDIVDHEDNIPLSTNDMKEDEVQLNHNDEHANKSTGGGEESTGSDTPTIVNSLEKPNEEAEFIDTEVLMNENKAGLHDDKDEDGPLSQLRVADNDTIDSDEGSGDEEGITTAPHGTVILDDLEDNESKSDDGEDKELSPDFDNMDFNIDSESTSEKPFQAEKESEEEPPISDPTEGDPKVDNKAKILTPEENSDEEPKPTENFSNVDRSQTYDPKTIVNPFNIDKGSDISKTIGKALGIIDNFETTTENEEIEGSGGSIIFQDNELDKDPIEDDAVGKTDQRILQSNENTDDSNDEVHEQVEGKEITELPIVTKHHTGLFNPVRAGAIIEEPEQSTSIITTQSVVANEEEITSNALTELPIETAMGKSKSSEDTGEVVDEMPDTTNTPENEHDLPLTAGINEVGLTNNKIKEAPEESDSTSSSSTGSFIVLGAIVATIVILLAYSVIKSRKQKQHNIRRSRPQENAGTELKERITLLPGENGHRPGNGNVETGKLLNVNEGDKNDLNNDERESKIINGENGTGNQYLKVPNIEDPDVLREVKINKPNAQPPNTLDIPDQPVANGVGLNSSPESCQPPGEPSLPAIEEEIYGTKPEVTKVKMFIDADSIPKTPIVIIKRGPPNAEF